jgi:hypothetical protein
MRILFVMLFLLQIFASHSYAMYETDVLGFQIANSFKTGRDVSVEEMQSWLNIYPKSSLRSNSTILTDDKIETNPLVEVIDEEILSEEAVHKFHDTLKKLDQKIRSDFIWLVFNYVH